MPTSSKSSSTDLANLQQTFLRLREELEQWWMCDPPRAVMEGTLERRLASLEDAISDPLDLASQMRAVSEGQISLIHIDRPEVLSLFHWRQPADPIETAQFFGVEPDNLDAFAESVVHAQVECLYRRFGEDLEGVEDDFWAGGTAPGPFMDRMYQLTLDTLSEDECLFVECLAAARKREEERERGCGSTA
jgi:hypothetical protein